MESEMYLLLNTDQEIVAKGLLENGSSESIMQLRITEGDPDEVETSEVLCLLGSKSGELPVQCRVTYRKGKRFVFQKMMTLNPDLRKSYRVPADFESFVYPVSGLWLGRKAMKAADISCGGIAFYAASGMQVGEVAEVVISNVTFPVIVQVGILRVEQLGDGKTFYCAKFLNLSPQEEEAVCRAVFSIQIQHRKNSPDRDGDI